uniref:Uncharacterized protein n=1 Tax=Amphimedon queenslandica TaxID=400682 RepID=A0A1X7UJM2_AMPQE
MFQVKIMVFAQYSCYRDWHTYVPRFTSKICMTPMKVTLYLYHIKVLPSSKTCNRGIMKANTQSSLYAAYILPLEYRQAELEFETTSSLSRLRFILWITLQFTIAILFDFTQT